MARPGSISRRILVLLVITAMALMTLDVRGFGPIDSARSAVFGATEPVRGAVAGVSDPVEAAWNGAVHYDELLEENERLRADLAAARGEVARLPDVEADLAALREAVGVPGEVALPSVVGRIVSDRDTGIERIIEIDRGTDDGVLDGMPVVVGSGLVGVVVDAYAADRATVRLITDPRVSIPVSGVIGGQTAVASGDGDGRPLRVEILAQSLESVRDGERFETNAFSRRFPADIPVGTAEFDRSANLLTIEPFVELDELVFVTVILEAPTP